MKVLAKTTIGAMALAIFQTATAQPAVAQAYPPVSAYMMPRAEEVALARTAAPANISGPATIEVLTPEGYQVVETGTNGFVCLVMRGFTAPTYTPEPFLDLVYDQKVRAPICFNPLAVQRVMPYYELRTNLGLQGKSVTEIRAGVEAAYREGRLPRRDAVSFGYMWSAQQYLGPRAGHWHPHLMIFAPNLTNAMLGGNPFGSTLPQLSDDDGTPFSVAVVPVDSTLAVGQDHATMAMPGAASEKP